MTSQSSPEPTTMSAPAIPPLVFSTALSHLARKGPLASQSDTGPTLYALTITGLKKEGSPPSRASLSAPATDAAELSDDWSAEASIAATRLLSDQAASWAGQVVVVITIEHGGVLHCMHITVPAARRIPRQRKLPNNSGRAGA